MLAVSWFEIFKPFTTFHLAVVIICAALMAASCLHGKRTLGTPAEKRFRFAWAISIIAFQIFADTWRLVFRVEDAPDGNLPLQLCRIAPWVAVVALFTMNRNARAILYFWGLGLCFQGFVTPMRFEPTSFGGGGLFSMDFWLFWIGHLQIVGSAIYDLVVHRFRPTFADFRVALLASWAYTLIIIPVNLLLDADYGYLGKEPAYRTRNIIDRFPPWPWRTLCMIMLVQTWLTLYLIVWRIPRFVRRIRGLNPDGDSPNPVAAQTTS